MAKGIVNNEPHGRDVYPDIIDHPHWQSPIRPHMSLYDRAAQFASFDALAGYTDMVKEEQRETDMQVQPEAWKLEILNQKLHRISDAIVKGEQPTVTITYFVPDDKKSGGSYETVSDTVKKVDTVYRKIVLMSTEGRGGLNRTIDFGKIISIEGKLTDELDDCFM